MPSVDGKSDKRLFHERIVREDAVGGKRYTMELCSHVQDRQSFYLRTKQEIFVPTALLLATPAKHVPSRDTA